VRIACLVVPLFPLAARLRAEPELKHEAVAVCEGNGNAARVVAATRIARRAGIVPGLTLPQARALLPKLIARGRDAEAERAAHETLLDVAEAFSPRVEDGGGGVVFLDVDHFHVLGKDEEDAQARALLKAALDEGLPARAGIAGSKLAARVAAAQPGGPTVVPGGGEASFLAPLPLERLGPEIDVASTLARWGLRSIGDLAKLPAAEVSARLGEAGRALHETARGLDPLPLLPRQPPPVFTEGLELEWPLLSLEPFLALAEGALERLARRLEAQAVACARLDLALTLEPEGCDTRSLALPAPTRDVKTLLTLVRLDLEARAPGAAVVGFVLTAHPDRPRRGQLTLFGPLEISPDRLAAALAKLLALLGEGRVGAPRAVDGHRPERHAVVSFAPPPPPLHRPPPRGGRGLLAVRVLRPAVPLEVLTGEAGGGLRLLSVRPLPNTAPPSVSIQGEVRVASGPWGMEEAWWSEAPAAREYWDIELGGGGLYRVFREPGGGEWFADGVYD
jgi:protein ImuB